MASISVEEVGEKFGDNSNKLRNLLPLVKRVNGYNENVKLGQYAEAVLLYSELRERMEIAVEQSYLRKQDTYWFYWRLEVPIDEVVGLLNKQYVGSNEE